MKGIVYLLRVLLLFLFAFGLSRFIFACYFYSLFSQDTFLSILLGFYHALRVDIGTACYLLLFPVFILLVESIFAFRWLSIVRQMFILSVLFIHAMVTSADLGLYQEWGVKMNYRALLYLMHPSEVVATATSHQILVFLLLTVFQTAICYALYFKIVRSSDHRRSDARFISFVIYVATVPLLVLGIRGGWQEVPMQASDSYFSTDANLNWLAVNSLWNMGQSVTAGMQYGLHNPYPFFDKSEAKKIVDSLYATQQDSTDIFLSSQHPNIVLIIFEGWSADLMASISHDQLRAATPNFDHLAADGLLFTDCIASGERSDQGLAAILSSFPSLPLSSVVNYPEKVDQLPSLLKPFKENGYSSLFLFGGQLSYGNIKALIYHNGFDKVIEDKDIDHGIHRGRLGVHDEYTFDILSNELGHIKPPFVAGFFTQSTHFSYDYPKAKQPLLWAGTESDYANSMMYADSCLGDFFTKARKQSWYANTLFVLVSDHSHVLPWNNNHQKQALHHIPLLFYGEVIRKDLRGARQNQIVSQQDIPATLLSQLHIPHTNFKWSKDIMNPGSQHFAYWTFTDGFGFSRDSVCNFVYDLGGKRILSQPVADCDSVRMKEQGLSYLQMVFEDFISTGDAHRH